MLELQRKLEVPRFSELDLVRGWEPSVPGFPLHQVSEHRASCRESCVASWNPAGPGVWVLPDLQSTGSHSEQGHFLCACGTSWDEADHSPTYAQVS